LKIISLNQKKIFFIQKIKVEFLGLKALIFKYKKISFLIIKLKSVEQIKFIINIHNINCKKNKEKKKFFFFPKKREKIKNKKKLKI
jgi:hypothetical protein